MFKSIMELLMVNFRNDYSSGCHPLILEKLVTTNDDITSAYGADVHSGNARELIKAVCNQPDADVHFFTGGTQTNLTVIAAMLRPYQGVISANSGHINVHECGAVEATGHRIIAIESCDGTLSADDILKTYNTHYEDTAREHTTQPAMVYISNPSELGTLYKKQHLQELYAMCKKLGLMLFIDGARLGYGLGSPECDFDLADIAENSDIFYIGGTKCGAFIGEAVVITNDALKKDFEYNVKQRGAMIAKSRLVGIQFEVLFTDNLYQAICKQAIDYSLIIKDELKKAGVELASDSYTNMQFPIFSNELVDKIAEKYSFEVYGKVDDNRKMIRFCTSWSTTQAEVDSLVNYIKSLA